MGEEHLRSHPPILLRDYRVALRKTPLESGHPPVDARDSLVYLCRHIAQGKHVTFGVSLELS